MPASPKTKRTPPANKFEDYILTYTVGEGLYPVDSSTMTYLSSTGVGSPFSVGEEIIDIGFNFRFDETTYSKIHISTYGTVILIDPAANPANVLSDTMGSADDNSSILPGPWASRHIVLSPWWSSEVRSIYRNITDSGASSYVTGQGLTVNNVTLGISPMPLGIDSRHGGIKSYKGFDSRDGKFLLLRWKIFANPNGSQNVVSFDVVIYESGILEFRYAPRSSSLADDYEIATIAVFANGVSANRYRDFSYLMRRDNRGKYRNGGTIYNGSYTNTNAYGTANYTVDLNVKNDWPGLDKGATFRLTPPRNKRRQSRKVINDRDSSNFMKSGMFNDQKTVNFNVQKIQYPTMLPIDYVTSMNDIDSISIVELCSSGSIEVNMNLSSGLFDDAMRDAIAERGKKQ